MITTLTGKPLQILSGGLKSIKGTKPFRVKILNSLDDKQYLGFLTYLLRAGKRMNCFWEKSFYLRKHEMKFENESELYDALKIKKVD